MSIQFNQFRPGDLIRAESMTQIFAYLQSLDGRIAKLEASGIGGIGPMISALVPSVAHAGDQLEIRGQNFALPASSNIVSVGGFPINSFVSGTSTSLVFSIPFINVSGAQQLETVAVQTQFGSDQRQLTLLPALNVPTGAVAFTQDPANATIGAIQPSVTYLLGFSVQSQTNIAEAYQVGMTVSNVTGSVTSDQWQAAATLVDASNNPVSTAPIQFQPFQPQTFRIRLVVPAGAAQGSTVNLGLSMRSLHNAPQLSRNSDPVAITVGQKPPVADPRVQWILEVPASPLPTDANPARLVTDVNNQQFVELPYSGSSKSNTGLVQVKATFKIDGNFAYAVSLTPANAPWTIGSFVPQNSLGKSADENELVGAVLTLNASAPAAGHPEQAALTVRATRSPTATSAVKDVFDSWTTLGIRGYTP